MRNKRKPSTGDGVPVVTYSRLPEEPEAPGAGPHTLRDAEPWLEGVEVPLVGREKRARRAAPDIRAAAYDDPPIEPAAAAADPFEPKQRPRRRLNLVLAVTLAALLAGFGILALTFHFAMTVTAEAPPMAKDPQAEIADLQRQLDQLANSAGSASAETKSKIAEIEARLADLVAAKPAAGSAAPAVRAVTTDSAASSAADAAPAAAAVPPAPREKPIKKEARAAPAAADKPAPAAKPVAAVTEVAETPPIQAEPKAAAVPPARVKPAAAAPDSDADFIANVEKALSEARPDPKLPPRAAATPVASAAAAPVAERPAVAPPARAGSADALPNDIGPAVRVIPPAGASADARPVLLAPATIDPTALPLQPAPATPVIAPQPGTPVPPEPIPNVQ